MLLSVFIMLLFKANYFNSTHLVYGTPCIINARRNSESPGLISDGFRINVLPQVTAMGNICT